MKKEESQEKHINFINIKKMHIKTMTYHFSPIQIVKI